MPNRDLGAQPCELCGQWTHSWCEVCSQRPFNAVCTLCDADHTLYVDHVSVLGGRGKRPAPRIPHRPIASNSAATTTRLAGLFSGPTAPHPTSGCVDRWHHRCRPVAPPCLRRRQQSESPRPTVSFRAKMKHSCYVLFRTLLCLRDESMLQCRTHSCR